jgi:hypothetical protein
MSFRNHLDSIFELYYTQDTYTLLEAEGLTPDQIDQQCCAELLRVTQERYESPQNSDRLDGFGWSSSKIQEHMKRYLKEKLTRMCHVLRTKQR